jgi:sterol desaturase/sphingolipid hydroxylase (fatty acid hydroxylase superfamily)
MPTPIEILLDPASLVALAMYGGLMAVEWLAPGRRLPEIGHWRLRGLTAFVAFFYLSTYLPLMWDEHLARFQLFDLTGLGTLGGIIAGLLVYELGAYWWHRAMHASDLLWRGVHQMHHSAERLDTFGAFWFSPLDMIGWTSVGSLTLVMVVGVTPQAATILLLSIAFLGMFQHANIRTPHWLGYLIQRPESHTIHHGKGLHRYNYADLPVFDMLFGTFRNPRDFEMETGFYPGASARVVDMLLFRDLNRRSDEDESVTVANRTQMT